VTNTNANRNIATPQTPDDDPSALTLDAVFDAHTRIAPHIARTPTLRADKLSLLTGADLWMKLECLQFTGSFKQRGALNKLLSLDDAARQRGVIAASAGNHAQGVAYHAQAMAIPATIVMPTTTPDVKVRQTRALGAEIVLYGDNFDQANGHALARCKDDDLTYVHPFDDPAVIAGQATIALEMLDDAPLPDCVLVPIGGGGLMAGMALVLRQQHPEIEIIGVQTELFPSMVNALDAGTRPTGGDTLAEGIAVREAGHLTRTMIAARVDDIVLVNERHLEKALTLIMNEQKILVEGAGAAGLAAMLCDAKRFQGKRVSTVFCGGNIDQRLLSMILMRDLARSGRLARLRVQLLDKPGQLVRVSSIVARQDGNVIDVGHHRTYSDLPAKMTCMDLTIDTQGQDHLNRILDDLRGEGYDVEIAAY